MNTYIYNLWLYRPFSLRSYPKLYIDHQLDQSFGVCLTNFLHFHRTFILNFFSLFFPFFLLWVFFSKLHHSDYILLFNYIGNYRQPINFLISFEIKRIVFYLNCIFGTLLYLWTYIGGYKGRSHLRSF